MSRKELAKFEKEIQKTTRLNSAYIQQCKDKAIWMWKSYNKLYKKWQFKLKKAKNNQIYNKLLKREPSKPFSKSNNKIPVRLDYRTINLKSNLKLNGKLAANLKENKLSDLWINLTSLKKHDKILVPLNSVNYHLNKLKEANKIIDCELIKKNNKYYIHLNCQYEIPPQQIEKIRAIDLGISRSIVTVLSEPGKELNKNSFLIIKEGKKRQKLQQYDNLIAVLQNEKKYKALKRIRKNRKNFIEDSERKLAEKISKISINCLLGIGYPKGIKYSNYKGNGNKQIRKRLHKWSYNRMISYIIQSCEEKGIEAIRLNEYNTSKTCSKCYSRNTLRPYQSNWSLFHCISCNITLNADINASINQSKLIMRQVSLNQWASDEHAVPRDDCFQKSTSLETQNISVQ